ncbi:hypothetical protein IWX47DRAFT_882275 [Phyllosticta citricarpa]
MRWLALLWPCLKPRTCLCDGGASGRLGVYMYRIACPNPQVRPNVHHEAASKGAPTVPQLTLSALVGPPKLPSPA